MKLPGMCQLDFAMFYEAAIGFYLQFLEGNQRAMPIGSNVSESKGNYRQ